MSNKFNRTEHFKKHRNRITKIKKDVRDRKIIERLKEKIKQRRKVKDG
jgi:hypothetical protein